MKRRHDSGKPKGWRVLFDNDDGVVVADNFAHIKTPPDGPLPLLPDDVWLAILDWVRLIGGSQCLFKMGCVSREHHRLLGVKVRETMAFLCGTEDRVLSHCRHLTELSLHTTRHQQISCGSLSLMTNLTSLTLDLASGHITDLALAPLTRLQLLRLRNQQWVTGVTLPTGLTALDLHDNARVTGDALTRLQRLTSLDLYGNKRIDDASLGTLTALTELNLCYNPRISDRGLLALTNLRALNLRLNDCITGECFATLTQLTRLNLVHCTRVTDEAVAHLPHLAHLEIDTYSAVSAAVLCQMTALQHLSWDAVCLVGLQRRMSLIYAASHIKTEDNQHRIATALPSLTSLQTLTLGDHTWVTSDILCRLTGLQTLAVRDASVLAVNDTVLGSLSGLQSLSWYSDERLIEKAVDMDRWVGKLTIRDESGPNSKHRLIRWW